MKKYLLLIFLSLFVTIQISATDVTSSLGSTESVTEYQVGEINYRKITLKDNDDSHIIYNAELPIGGNFEVVLHDLLFGDNAQGLSTVMEIAKDYEEKTGKVVYAATNGDYFTGGLPVDFYAVENNILRVGPYSHTLGKNAFGFTNDGTSITGKVTYGYQISIYNETGELVDTVHIDKINDPLSDGEVGIYTFNNTSAITGTNIAKMSIRLDEINGNYAFPYRGTLADETDFLFNDDTYSVSYKDFVIAAKGDSEGYQTLLQNVTSTSTLTVYPYPTETWQGIDYIIGGWQILMQNGTKLPEAIHDGGYSFAPRTSIGMKADGTIGLVVTDGRMTNIPGLDLTQLATLNEELGYVTALELDGGGSSTFLLRNLETDELEIMNTPSDGNLRNVANAVLIVGDKIETDDPVDPVDPDPVDPNPTDPTPEPEPDPEPTPTPDNNSNIWVYIIVPSVTLFGAVLYIVIRRK